MPYDYANNRIKKDVLRAVQGETINQLADILKASFGPMGSTTIIRKPNALNRYTKDGHTILTNIEFKGDIEQAVKEDIEALTRNTVLGVGDSSTSIVLLAALIFNRLADLEMTTDVSPSMIIDFFKKSVEKITKKIESYKRETDLDAIYKIAITSTNNDEDLSMMLYQIYKQYGMQVFIDVVTSTTQDTIVKEYDGLTLNSGYSENIFINNTSKGICSIRNANIYAFEDPIDTPEMAVFLDKILYDNIYQYYESQGKKGELKPTIIMAPKISRDLSSIMDILVQFLSQIPNDNAKPPIEIITNIYDTDTYLDIARLCGCKTIKKYIDPKIQEKDIKAGIAPTPETIHTFAGTADLVESDLSKTKFVRPGKMYNKDGSTSDTFNSMIKYLEAELDKAIKEGEDIQVRGTLKRRLNALKANMVEVAIGGITVADRDAKRDLFEDAVLNCRSAAENGYGYGANFEGLIAALEVVAEAKTNKTIDDVLIDLLDSEGKYYTVGEMDELIASAYIELLRILYRTKFGYRDSTDYIIESVRVRCPIDLRCDSVERADWYNSKVLSSIKADIIVLETISKIVTLMITSNQFLTPSYLTNLYDQVDIINDEDGFVGTFED